MKTPSEHYNELMHAVGIISKVEQEMSVESDGRTMQTPVTRASFDQICEIVSDAVWRNLFPKGTKEQREAYFLLSNTRDAFAQAVKRSAEDYEMFDVQREFEEALERARALFPLDELNAVQRHCLEVTLFAPVK
jgi:hypothetical protein